MNYNSEAMVRWEEIKNVAKTLRQYFSNPIYNFIGFTIVYFALIILLPVNQSVLKAYHLTAYEYHVLLFIVELPLIFVWFSAFYGYHKLKEYSALIHKTKEGAVFKQLTTGSHWLAWGFVLPSMCSLILSAIANRYHSFNDASLIFSNYFNLVFPVVAFSIIADGAHKLVAQGRIKSTFWSVRVLLLVFVTIGTLYCYLTFRYLDLKHLTSTNNPYYLPVWLLITTIIIPYLYTWIIGLSAAYQFGLFAGQVKGIIYRRSLQLAAAGVVLVIIASIGVQYLHSVIPRTGHLSLNYLLIATYLIYLVIIIGFVLICYGANHLKKIEDI
jgi:hypothetical protein